MRSIDPLAGAPGHVAGRPISTDRLLAPLRPLTIAYYGADNQLATCVTRVRGVNRAAADALDRFQREFATMTFSQKFDGMVEIAAACCLDASREILESLEFDVLEKVVMYCTRQMEEARAVIETEMAASEDASGNGPATAEMTESPSRTGSPRSRSSASSPEPKAVASAM